MNRYDALARWLATAILGLPVVGGFPAGALPAVEIERFEHLYAVEASSTITVTNVFGDIRARFGGYAPVVEVRAVLQQFAAEGPRLGIEVEEGSFGLRIAVVERPEAAGAVRGQRQPGQKKRADLVIFVPQGVALAAETGEGEIELRGLRGNVSATSQGGSIHARSIQGNVALSSVRGAIIAAPHSLDLPAVQRFSTESGDITLRLAGDGHFTCRASTGGLLSTDFSLAIETDPDASGRKRALARIGKGTTPLAVESQSGHLRLIRRPSAAEARTAAPAEPP